MDFEIHQYWQNRLDEVCQSRDEMLDQLRDEISRLQQRCSEMSTINTMGKAAVGYDVMNFAADAAVLAPNGQKFVSLQALNEFLHNYSEGLVPYERPAKRGRDAMSLGHDMFTTARSADMPVVRPFPVPQTAAQAARHQPGSAPAAAVEADDAANDEQVEVLEGNAVVEEPNAEKPQVACRLQHRRTLDQYVKRERGAPMDDEVTQVRPWLFSRVP